MSSIDALFDAAMLESMAISDPTKLITAGGATSVDHTCSVLTKDGDVDMAVDNECNGAQRAGSHHRSLAL